MQPARSFSPDRRVWRVRGVNTSFRNHSRVFCVLGGGRSYVRAPPLSSTMQASQGRRRKPIVYPSVPSMGRILLDERSQSHGRDLPIAVEMCVDPHEDSLSATSSSIPAMPEVVHLAPKVELSSASLYSHRR